MYGSKWKRIVFSLAVAGLLSIGLYILLNRHQIVQADPGNVWFATSDGTGSGCTQAQPCTPQTALAQASDDDTIYLAQGRYTGTGDEIISVSKSITLYGGWDGTATAPPTLDPQAYPTILDGENKRRGIYISGDVSPRIDGLTIANGNASHASIDPSYGGGIYSSGANPVIANNVIENNTASTSTNRIGEGGGIYIAHAWNGTLIEGNQVRSNVASSAYHGYGGGMYLLLAPSAQVADNVVVQNTASITGGGGLGGGIHVSSSDGAIITGNKIEHNVGQQGHSSLTSYGGGVYCYNTIGLTLSSNTIRHNTAGASSSGNGGGVRIKFCDKVTVAGNMLQDNVACAGTTTGSGRGGGMETYRSGVTIHANWVTGNTAGLGASPSYGGGLYLSRGTSFTLTNNIVAANQANYQGGGMAFETGGASEPVSGILVHNTFAANDQGSGEGRIAIHLNAPHVTLVLTNNLISEHTYGVHATTNSTATLDHTCFYANSGGDTGGAGTITNANPVAGQDPLLNSWYHLQLGSPAADAGIAIPWLPNDIDGDSRPLGKGYDIGADELRVRSISLPLVWKN
jgi:hypothetical protein